MAEKELMIGDLVVFETPTIGVLNNSIGVVIGTNVSTEFQAEYFSTTRWYVVQFGSMKLIVNDSMVSKLEP